MTTPFSKAVATQYLYTRQDSTAVFAAELTTVWSVFGAIHGGYSLAVITDALSQWQSPAFAELASDPKAKKPKPAHPDPAHLQTQYFVPVQKGRCDIHVKVTATGKSWTNLSAMLYQSHSASPLISVLALFTQFPSLPSGIPHSPFSTTNQDLLPLTPGPYSRQSPFVTHPSQCSDDPELKEDAERRRWARDSVLWFIPEHIKWTEDQGVKARREGRAPGQTSEKRSLEWAAWLEFTDEKETLEKSLPFWADIFSSIPELFPDGERVDPHYYPTLALSLQFHTSLSALRASEAYLCAPRTIGCYSTGSMIHAGRHEQLCEVWSAPGPIGSGEVQDNWRARTFPILTSTQLALSVHTDKLVARQATNKITKPGASKL